VTVLVKGTTLGTLTDASGKYTIDNVPQDATFVFSFVGMTPQEIPSGGRAKIDVIMKEEAIGLDEVIVIGYGTARKADLTGSVVRVQSEAFQNQAITQIGQMLTGTIAGFAANQSTKAAGGSSMEIRGKNTLTAGSSPMVVLDGAVYNGSIGDINPNDIESIDVLKDASSAAVFGSKAASGVILVTTTKGSLGKPTINFATKLGMSEITNKDFHPYQGEKYLDFRRDFFRTRGYALPDYYWHNPNELPEGVTLDMWRNASANPATDNIVEWTNRLNLQPFEVERYLAGETIDWMDEVFRQGIQQDYDLGISGGTNEVKYYWSIGYVDNEGIVLGDQFSAIRSRLNVDFNVTNWLKVGTNTQYAYRDESTIEANISVLGSQSPYARIWDEDGTLRWFPSDDQNAANPLVNTLGQDRLRKINSLFAAMFAEVKLPLGFNYRLSFQPRFQNIRDHNFWPVTTITGARTYTGGYGTRQDYAQVEWMVDNLLKWNKEIGIHNFDLTLLYNAENIKNYNSQYANQTFLPSGALSFHGMQFGTVPSVTSNDTEAGGNALMARLNYTLLGKYLLTTSIRRDGYSAFGQENPTAIFPAVALAWKISDEDFFNIDLINRLKLRLSWGVNGNRDIGIYAALAQLGSNMYYNSSQVKMGVYTSTLSNYGLRWERTESINAGLDIGIFNDQIDLTVDFYDMSTTDLLMNRQLPRITGFSSITANLGKLGNRGFEITLKTINVDQAKITWKSNLVFSLNRNEIKKLFGNYEDVEIKGVMVRREIPDYTNQWFPGKAIDVVWNYDILGIWQLGEETEAAVYKQKPGEYKALDVDQSGNYTEKEDKVFLGNKEPQYRIGLNNEFAFLKNFTASVFVRADLDFLRDFSYVRAGTSTMDRVGAWARPYWTPTDPNNEWPSLAHIYTALSGLGNYLPSSYVRIQDVSLSYTVPASLSRRFQLENLRIYGSVRNLVTFTKWPGFDPESGTSPMPRTYTLGISLSL
jgi:TonB-linked SusC/RagA family outer membrane protein